jgi:predicted nucleic acid-binding protein
MATYLLDTTVIIDAINDKRNRNRSLISLAEEGNTLACCAINIAEVYAGMRTKEEVRTNALLHSLQLYPITFAVAELAGRLKRDYSARGKTRSITDTLIVAVALYHYLSLVTDNVKDFPMPELSFHTLPA